MVMKTFSNVIPSTIMPFCEAMGELWGSIERSLYKDLKRGHSVTHLKKEYQVKYGINARQFNSIYQNVRGKIKSTSSGRKREIEQLQLRIKELEKSLHTLTRKIDPKVTDKRIKKVDNCCRLQAKKRTEKEMGVKYSRMLSSFAYHKFAELLFSRADKYGIQVISTNPAYSSLIGLSKFMKRYGLSSDTAAALVLARRALWLSERPPANYARLVQADPDRHVWSFWRKLSKKLKGVSRHSFFGDSVTNSESEVNLLDELSDNRFEGKLIGTSDNRRDSGSRIVGKAVRPAS
jgi:hypothetical protein